MVGRLGAVELRAVWISDSLIKSRRKVQGILDGLENNAGFFPNDMKYLKAFSDVMKTACGSLDLFGTCFNPMEDYIVEKYGLQCELSYLRGLEPWYVENPWTINLKGKQVLIIYPFENTIKNQYKIREKLFPDKEILPKLGQLYVLKAVQTIAGERDERFHNWFEALEWMYQEAMKFDFEIAIIGCGAYGFPLAAKIKNAGRQAIHLGGATQLLFGIKGKRWDEHPVISKFYNEYWVRPDSSEIPLGAKKVEEGCYW